MAPPIAAGLLCGVPPARKPLFNSLWIIGGRLASAVVTLAVIGVTARHLGAADFGQLAWVIAVMAIAAPLATLSLDQLVVKALVREPDQSGHILGSVLGLRLLSGLVTAGLVSILAWLVAPTQAHWVALASISLAFQTGAVVDLWFQRHLLSKRSVISRTTVIYLGAALKLGLVAAEASLGAFVAVIVVESVLYASGFVISYATSPVKSAPWRWDARWARYFARTGLPLAVAGVLAALGTRFDQMLVATQMGGEVAGQYLAASRFSEFVLFTGAAVMTSLFPRVAEAANGASQRERLQAFFDAIGLLGWAAALSFVLLAPVLVAVVLGPGYEASVNVLRVQGVMLLLVLSSQARWQAVLLTAPTAWNLMAAVLTVGTQLAVIRLCVQQFGLPGAAVAAGLGALVGGGLTSWLVPSLRHLARPQLGGLLSVFAPGRWRQVFVLLTK